MLLMTALLVACDRFLPPRVEHTLPSPEQADSVLRSHGIEAAVRLSGNVLELTVPQPVEQLRRGGALWAKVGPYVYLFSPATQQLFATYPGIAAVRARTVLEDVEIARAQLVRDTLRAGDWARGRALLGTALQQGSTRPSRLEALVRWGEQFTEFTYNPEYVPAQGSSEQ